MKSEKLGGKLALLGFQELFDRKFRWPARLETLFYTLNFGDNFYHEN